MQRVQRQRPAPLTGGQFSVRVVLVRSQAEPACRLRRLRQLTAQANARGLRNIIRHFYLYVAMQHARTVNFPGFAAQEQRFAV
ncbi:hypothetical protein D3C80_870650 [compost metagenome]